MVREEKRGTVPGFVHREEHVVSDQPQSDWKEETGGRESRGPRAEGGLGGAARPHPLTRVSVILLGRLQLVSWFVCLLGWLSVRNLLVLLPSSLPG